MEELRHKELSDKVIGMAFSVHDSSGFFLLSAKWIKTGTAKQNPKASISTGLRKLLDSANILGPGLLESAYEGAFVIELEDAGMPFERQHVYPLYYKGRLASAYIADLVVDNTIIIELKSVSELNKAMEAQLINYLRLSKIEVGYLMNFHGTRLEWKRFVV